MVILPPPPDLGCALSVSALRERGLHRQLHRAAAPTPVNEQMIEAAESVAEDLILASARKWQARRYAMAARIIGLVVNGWTQDEADAEVTRGNRPAGRTEIRKAERAKTVRPAESASNDNRLSSRRQRNHAIG